MAGLNRGSIHLFDLLNRLCLAQVVLLSTYLVVSTSPAAAAAMPSGKRCRGDVATQFKMGTPGSGSKRSRKAGTFELQPPRTYTDAEFTKLEARLLAAHGQGTKDGALATVLDAAATEVLFRLTGQHGLQFRDCQRDVLEHIIYGARSTFYLAPCGAGKSLVLWVSGCSLRGHGASSWSSRPRTRSPPHTARS